MEKHFNELNFKDACIRTVYSVGAASRNKFVVIRLIQNRSRSASSLALAHHSFLSKPTSINRMNHFAFDLVYGVSILLFSLCMRECECVCVFGLCA